MPGTIKLKRKVITCKKCGKQIENVDTCTHIFIGGALFFNCPECIQEADEMAERINWKDELEKAVFGTEDDRIEARKFFIRTCPKCFTVFQPSNNRQVWCKDSCRSNQGYIPKKKSHDT